MARKPNLYIKIGSSEFSGRFLRGSGAIFYVSNRWQKGGGIVGPDFQLERSNAEWRKDDLIVTVISDLSLTPTLIEVRGLLPGLQPALVWG